MWIMPRSLLGVGAGIIDSIVPDPDLRGESEIYLFFAGAARHGIKLHKRGLGVKSLRSEIKHGLISSLA